MQNQEEPLELQLDKANLKIQALLEKISNLAANYENQAADFRVDLTLLTNQNQELIKKVEEFEAPEEKGTPKK